MKRTLTINIVEPCHENWKTMTLNQKGRHCQVCDKTVVDFTEKKDAQLISAIKQNEHKLCGRFNPSQLNRNIPFSKNRKRNRFSFLVSGLFAFFAFYSPLGNHVSLLLSSA